MRLILFFFFQAEDGIRDRNVTGVQTCALPIWTMVDGGAQLVGANCEQEPERMLTILREMRGAITVPLAAQPAAFRTTDETRSEERRVGKECRTRWGP